MKEAGYLRDQKRDVRDLRPILKELMPLLLKEDSKEKIDLARILDEFDEFDESGRRRINPEMKIEAFPDYSTIQQAFINIAMRHKQGEKPFAIIS